MLLFVENIFEKLYGNATSVWRSPIKTILLALVGMDRFVVGTILTFHILNFHQFTNGTSLRLALIVNSRQYKHEGSFVQLESCNVHTHE